MPSTTTSTSATERPTLPSIHTLNLPLLAPANVHHATYDNAPMNMNFIRHDRRASTSSSATSASRSSSPSPSPLDAKPTKSTRSARSAAAALASAAPPAARSAGAKFRLVACPAESADAFVYVPPPGLYVPTATNYAARAGTRQGILLVGAALERMRRTPARPMAKGARLHPYRIVRGDADGAALGGGGGRRRASVATIAPLPRMP